MGRTWVDTCPELFEMASDAAGKDVRALVCDADVEELRRTDNAQLATAVCSIAGIRALHEAGMSPSAVAGHSLGEYSALVAAGIVSPRDAVRLVAARGEGMAAAASSPIGSMFALIGVDEETAHAACSRVDGTVVVANINAPNQIVISGELRALNEAVEIAKKMGAKKALPFDVGGAFHSQLMAPALGRLAAALAETEFSVPSVPFYANVDARPHDTASAIPPLLVAQLCSPVRWYDTLIAMSGAGIHGFVEVGVGGVLAKMAKRALRDAVIATVSEPSDAVDVAVSLGGIAPEQSRPADSTQPQTR